MAKRCNLYFKLDQGSDTRFAKTLEIGHYLASIGCEMPLHVGYEIVGQVFYLWVQLEDHRPATALRLMFDAKTDTDMAAIHARLAEERQHAATTSRGSMSALMQKGTVFNPAWTSGGSI